ncbi:HNH endonuclease [Pseudomonas massiliensis]|uniref:HNH endonuclease n=1 Tax=Pseudomonas massiliensis TaxID=522492 RepID=UPI000693C70C|nr:HNH endonuclease [Pseudomonas massiliensis]
MSQRREECKRRLISELLAYDSSAGVLRWKKDQGRGRAGEPAGAVKAPGYIKIGLGGFGFLAHRLIWEMHYGTLGDREIDHVNGIGTDNRLANLRIATRSENLCNTRLRSDNTSGVKGLYRLRTGKWRAEIYLHGKRITFGPFETVEAGKSALAAKRTELHGAFANEGTQAILISEGVVAA